MFILKMVNGCFKLMKLSNRENCADEIYEHSFQLAYLCFYIVVRRVLLEAILTKVEVILALTIYL